MINENEMLQDDGLSLFEVVNQLQMKWKTWAGGAVIGCLIGFVFWLSKGYEAVVAARPIKTLEFVQWRTLSNELPALADNLSNAPNVDPEMRGLYDLVSQADWWKKNITADYTFSKSDIKELSLSEKAVSSTTIYRVVIRAPGSTKEEAMRNAYDIERYIQDGGAFLAIKSLLSHYDLDSKEIYSQQLTKLSRGEIELAYLNKRTETLESLRKLYPDSSRSVAQTVLDPKDNAAKYLPLGTQLVAVKADIAALEESLSRSRDILEEQKVIKRFLEKGLPLLGTETSGFALGEKLSVIEKELRRSVDKSNKQQILALNKIAEKLDGVNVVYRQFFEGQSLATSRRASKSPVALGLFGGLLVGVVWAFLADGWRRARRTRQARTR